MTTERPLWIPMHDITAKRSFSVAAPGQRPSTRKNARERYVQCQCTVREMLSSTMVAFARIAMERMMKL
jgi:hypothetical protein